MTAFIQLGDRQVGGDAPPYIIAEIGVNHDGCLNQGIELVRAASSAGVDAVKFQWFSAEQLVVNGARTAEYQSKTVSSDQRSMLTRLELGCDEMARLVEVAHQERLHALVTVFCESLVEEASELDWDAWKCASPDLVHRPLLDRLASDGRAIILSTGAASMREVDRANQWLEESPVAFLQCVSAYPTPETEASLGGIEVLAMQTGRPCGYSDHTGEETTGGLAVAAGAKVLEKHFTHDRAAVGPDHGTSLEADGLARYVEFAHRAHVAVGPRGSKQPLDRELDVREVARQSLRASRPLAQGKILGQGDLVAKRPGDGMEPWRIEELLGRRLVRPLLAEEPLNPGDVE